MKSKEVDKNPYARVYTHCLKNSASDYVLHNSAACRNLTPEEIQRNYGLRSPIATTMPRMSDAPSSPSLEPSALNNKIEEAIYRLETAMQTQREEFQQDFQKTSDETSAALQLLKDFGPEAYQKHVKEIYSKISDHSEASKHTSEWVDKLTSEFFHVKRQNLTMSSQLEHICQHLGIKAAENNGGGGFSVRFIEARSAEPYVHPHRREQVNSSSVVADTPPCNEENDMPVIRLNLD